MGQTIITAKWTDGKIDEKSLFWTGTADVELGFGPKETKLKISVNPKLSLNVTLRTEEGEAIPTIATKYIEAGKDWEPRIGDGCSDGYNGDSYPYTVRKISPSGKTIWVSRDRHNVKPGKGEPYEEGAKDCFFIPQEVSESDWRCYKLKKDGKYRPAGRCGRNTPALSPGRSYSQNPCR